MMEMIIESELCKFHFRKLLSLSLSLSLFLSLSFSLSLSLSLSFICLVFSRSLSLSLSTTVHLTTSSLHKLPTLCELPLILINVVRVDVVASTWPLEFLRVYRCTEQDYGLSTLLLPRESSPFAQFISFQQELLNSARGKPDYERLC